MTSLARQAGTVLFLHTLVMQYKEYSYATSLYRQARCAVVQAQGGVACQHARVNMLHLPFACLTRQHHLLNMLMCYKIMYSIIVFAPNVQCKSGSLLYRICYVKAGLKMSCVMLLQNEKLVVDEFLEKVAAASRKVGL